MKLTEKSFAALLAGVALASTTAFAEPAVQPGETLESLSKAKIATTVNGQPGTLKEVLNQEKLTVISESAQPAPAATAPASTQPEQPVEAPEAAPTENAPAQAAPNETPTEAPAAPTAAAE